MNGEVFLIFAEHFRWSERTVNDLGNNN